MANHSNVITIWQRNNSAAIGNDVGWNPTGVIPNNRGVEDVLTTAGLQNNPMINLGHELAHIEYNWNKEISKTWFNMTVDRKGNLTQRPISTSEIYTTHIENQLRSENNLPLRTYYGKDQNGNSIGPRIIIPATRASRFYNSQGTTNYSPLKRGVIPYIY